MKKSMKYLLTVLFALVIAGSSLMTSCTRYADEEELKTLDETKAATLSAEEKVEQKKLEKVEAETELSQKKAELIKVQEEKKDIESKL